MPRIRGSPALRAALLALALLILAPAAARAAPPKLDSVGYSSTGQPTASFTIDLDSEPDRIEIATAPDTGPDGAFLPANVVKAGTLDEDDYFKAGGALPAGTYYVHVSAIRDVECDDVSDPYAPACAPSQVREWSNVLTLVIPPPKPGRYTGKTFFGERVTFVLGGDSSTISGLVADFDITCTRAAGVLRVSFPPITLTGLKFEKLLKVRSPGGGQMKFTVRGTMRLNGKATGRLDAIGSIKGAGKCRDFGNPEWSAKRK